MKKFTIKMLAYGLMTVAITLVFIQCSKSSSTSTTVNVPTLTTAAVNFSQSAPFVATSGGNVTANNGAALTAYGVCYGTSQNPDLTGQHTVDGTGGTGGVYVSTLTGLSPGTTYYVRAYATNSAGTAYGNLVQFTTGAANWSQVYFSGGTAMKSLSGISFSDDNHGFAFGINTNNQIMFMSSSDGGSTWTTPSVVVTQGNLSVTNNGGSLPTKSKSICFTSASNGWITYGGDSVLTTLNGGASWALVPYTTSAPVAGQGLNSTCFTGTTTGFIAGLGLYKTTTGTAWTNVNAAPAGTYFNSVYFIDANTGFAATNTNIYKSTDGGNTWQNIAGVSSPVYGFNYTGGVLYAAGSQSLLVSNDLGATWVTPSHSGPGGGATMYNLCFINQNYGVIATQTGLYQTTDGGNTWGTPISSSVFNDVCRTNIHIYAISGASIMRL